MTQEENVIDQLQKELESAKQLNTTRALHITALRQALRVIHAAIRTDEKGTCNPIRKYLDDRGIYNGNLSGAARLAEEVCQLALNGRRSDTSGLVWVTRDELRDYDAAAAMHERLMPRFDQRQPNGTMLCQVCDQSEARGHAPDCPGPDWPHSTIADLARRYSSLAQRHANLAEEQVDAEAAIARAEKAEAEVTRLREWTRVGNTLDNHHNALACPYCNPDGLTFAEATKVIDGDAR